MEKYGASKAVENRIIYGFVHQEFLSDYYGGFEKDVIQWHQVGIGVYDYQENLPNPYFYHEDGGYGQPPINIDSHGDFNTDGYYGVDHWSHFECE